MESRFELPAELISLKIINRMESSDLRVKSGVYKKNRFILKALRGKSETVIRYFIKSLENTEQPHVASYLMEVDTTSGKHQEHHHCYRVFSCRTCCDTKYLIS